MTHTIEEVPPDFAVGGRGRGIHCNWCLWTNGKVVWSGHLLRVGRHARLTVRPIINAVKRLWYAHHDVHGDTCCSFQLGTRVWGQTLWVPFLNPAVLLPRTAWYRVWLGGNQSNLAISTVIVDYCSQSCRFSLGLMIGAQCSTPAIYCTKLVQNQNPIRKIESTLQSWDARITISKLKSRSIHFRLLWVDGKWKRGYMWKLNKSLHSLSLLDPTKFKQQLIIYLWFLIEGS